MAHSSEEGRLRFIGFFCCQFGRFQCVCPLFNTGIHFLFQRSDILLRFCQSMPGLFDFTKQLVDITAQHAKFVIGVAWYTDIEGAFFQSQLHALQQRF